MQYRIFIMTIVGILSSNFPAFANEHGATGIPTVIYYQIFNFLIFITIMYFILRKPAKEFFSTRQLNYKKTLETVQAMRAEAESQKHEIKKKIVTLQEQADENKNRAKAEAEEMRQRILEEAKNLSLRLKQDAEKTAKVEIEKAIEHLREELLKEAISVARETMKNTIDANQQKNLNQQFVERIEKEEQL